ncbi:hypothetical protein GCM10010221_25430 [Streptomyces parvus]|nr:hypothetical protein GCM10010221_25430 [Streptomyces parvus]
MTQGRPLLNRRLATFGTTIFAEMSALAGRTGSINLGQGFPDTDGPEEIREAAVRALRAGHGNQYPPGPGVPELRATIRSRRSPGCANARCPSRRRGRRSRTPAGRSAGSRLADLPIPDASGVAHSSPSYHATKKPKGRALLYEGLKSGRAPKEIPNAVLTAACGQPLLLSFLQPGITRLADPSTSGRNRTCS